VSHCHCIYLSVQICCSHWVSLPVISALKLYHLNNVTLSVTWPFDLAYVVSYSWWLMTTMRLPCMFMEIQDFKYVGVMTLTFWGHVKSSVTWSLDSQYTVSYKWSIADIPLSCMVAKILHVRYLARLNLNCHWECSDYLLGVKGLFRG